MRFKGTNIGILAFTVQTAGGAQAVDFEIGYTDNEGVVHGTMRHKVPISVTPELETAVRALAALLSRYAESKHFEGGSSAEVLVPAVEGGLSAALDRQ